MLNSKMLIFTHISSASRICFWHPQYFLRASESHPAAKLLRDITHLLALKEFEVVVCEGCDDILLLLQDCLMHFLYTFFLPLKSVKKRPLMHRCII